MKTSKTCLDVKGLEKYEDMCYLETFEKLTKFEKEKF